LRSKLRTGVVLAVTVVLLAVFLRNADFTLVWTELRQASPLPIIASVGVMALVYLTRAWRWQYLLGALGPTHFGTAFRTTIIGFALNTLLPARPGEAVRPLLLARHEGLSFPSVFATIVVERVLDLIAVLLLFGSFVVLFDPGMDTVDARLYGAVKLGGGAAAATAVVALAVMIVLAGHPERLGRMTLAIERIMPSNVARTLARLVERFAGGFAAMRRPRDLLAALALSMPVWLGIALAVWLVARAFDLTFPFTGTFLLLALLVVGVAVPTPGGIGGFHEAFRIGATAFYGFDNDRSVSCALALHASQFLPVVAAGIVFMAQEGLTLGGITRLTGNTEDGTVQSTWRAERERGVAGAAGGAPAHTKK
jgi:glycosyltransferase 2 family protein